MFLFTGGHDTVTVQGSTVPLHLFGGSTAFDADPVALRAILAEWSRSDLSYAERVDHLLHGAGLSPVLNASTASDDGAADTLEGGRGRDLFFSSVGDFLTDRKEKKEVVFEV